ncbi:DMT family transporter [Salinisphaera sp.]|uniref:DMT family transporter n=1 Tax=Salinisphaera sp. TaxID=1914330 RepID=UPI002D799F0B|nr:DMT family transporter [Salinisphaera sp.]HET7314270.1 DMT family transporter [Salinisphaera sp.]
MSYEDRPAFRIIGLSGVVIFLWGVTAWLRMLAGSVPPLELTGIALIGAALSSCLLTGPRGATWSAIRRHPWYAWLTVGAGLVGGAAFYFAALTYAPAAQVVVITYSWPLLFAIASDVYSHRRPAPLTFVSLFVGLAGVGVMHGTTAAPSADAWLGYVYALASGLCWVAYSLFVQVYSRPIASAYPAFFAVGAVAALLLQAATGGLVWPGSTGAWTASIILGIGPYGLGFLAWGYVVRHGNPRIVPVLPYAVPAVAAITLVLVGRVQPTLTLWAGCALVIMACVASMRTRRHAGRV